MSKAKIAVISYSLWGHVAELAKEAAEGARATGADVTEYQIAETFSPEVLVKMKADKSLTKDLPVLNAQDLKNFDGLVFAFPTRFGRAPAQVSALFDRTGGLWASGSLLGKHVTMITSAGTQHGGVETTALTTFPFFVHHGMIYVPIGFQFPELSEISEITGISPYNAATVAGGNNSRRPTEKELRVSKAQGTYFAEIVGQFVRGKI
ncbi:putative 1,4-benzoquinone reductase [Acaromyces ingoldii]|uniref:Putative 1,4-benzoquinone reductase n=1 Tax=Acaromyces ingoldii TaxID=215250 RepID=A0A316YB05_9BASI|nr:putative 1,4-benzoquinone reductase [Acaromyces ingoldii]PWN86806.1 putative 1,4-benzoquinone reductase [Acaromyces ingoldii]